ncbi:DUF6460 domain-containing protein [Labrenzia sp. PHM005]|uniref:DUF6460 domain-containing protein n=1 Tax=Stappiaceae TaxID=2821832 RepID=UPI0011405EFE|nr:DUF6460 domain-containing protein [Labrenzia sp. PHM005]QDG78818.1 integrase [Labrenzia sp. PHM005]
MTDSSLNRFLGGSPGQVLLRLVFLSFVVGIILAALNMNPIDLVYMAWDFVEHLWNLGFDALGRLGGYLVAGAIIVLPVWVVLRLLSVGRGR